MLRVYHFILDHRVGGPHVYAKTIASALKDRVHSIFVTSGNGQITDIALINLRHIFQILYPLEILLNVIKLIWIFRNRGSRIKCIFDIHGAANIAPVFASRILRIPYVWHFHETLRDLKGIALLGRIGVSGDKHKYVVVARKSIEVFGLTDAMVIPGSIDLNFWHPTKLERSLRSHTSPLRLLTVGNLNPLKGQDILLDAMTNLNNFWELDIAGSSLSTHREYEATLKDKASFLSSQGSVRFLGWQSPEQLRKLLFVSDIFILPSKSEACPIALLEAMAMGCICIATNVGDVGEIIKDLESGFLVASNSSKCLQVAIKKASNMSWSERSKMSKSAQTEIVLRYSQERMAKSHLDLYLSLCK
jgi:glycosyltransferase involved in cell wall biosynthesis